MARTCPTPANVFELENSTNHRAVPVARHWSGRAECMVLDLSITMKFHSEEQSRHFPL